MVRTLFVWTVFVGTVWIVWMGAIAPPVHAAPLICRTVDQHQICILNVKRSAKNYWEYRATVQIDGDRKPLEIYDCRHRIKIQRDGSREKFQPNGAGALICELLH
ncbi:MAG: hypothetical protein VKL39_09175 [Leptolyngbyaceae bacterium]|nr:hypothetical protein [Leptolyngbyaceae bacterium]